MSPAALGLLLPSIDLEADATVLGTGMARDKINTSLIFEYGTIYSSWWTS